MQCVNCGKHAAREYIRNAEGQKLRLMLCPACYAALYPEEERDLFSSFVGKTRPDRHRKECPACGTTIEMFRRTGLVGCATCYTALREELMPSIRFVQANNVRHDGKEPSADAEEKYDLVRGLVQEQEAVKAQLERAVKEHNDGEVARLKARLREIKRKLYSGEGI